MMDDSTSSCESIAIIGMGKLDVLRSKLSE